MTRRLAVAPLVGVGLVMLLEVALPRPSLAQEAGTRLPVPHRQQITTNPFGLVLTWFNGEYERKLRETWTWALGGSYVSVKDPDEVLATVGIAFRYYPQEAALTGFWVGPRVGYVHYDDRNDTDDEMAPAVGVELGYSWLLGSERHFSITVGGGVSKMFSGPVVPTAKLINVGWAF